MSNCYLCGAENADRPLVLKESFTAHSLAKCPQSHNLCWRCEWSINSRFWYFNPSKNSWSVLYFRGVSSLWYGDRLIAPKVGDLRTDQGKQGEITFPVISGLPTRADIRSWLFNPPEPPFTIAIAESGQKHILFLAQTGFGRDYFPVQFELDCLWIDRSKFVNLVLAFEKLMGLGFSKTEIMSGNYRGDRLMKVMDHYLEFDLLIETERGGRLLDLVSYVSQNLEDF